MRTNKKVERKKRADARLAGGFGPAAAKQDAAALLRRAVMGCLLWEDLFYESGVEGATNIAALIPQVDPVTVRDIAIEARTVQKLRHVPLFIAREMARHDSHKGLVGDLLPRIILRADELAEFLAIYWKEGKQPISSQVKRGLAAAFLRFNEYNFAKYDRDGAVKLRDVMFLTHPNPSPNSCIVNVAADRRYGRHDNELFRRLAEGKLGTPDTWEVALSAGDDKKATWERLITEGKIGALAFVRNLRNMEQAGVDRSVIRRGFDAIDPSWLLPVNYITAAKAAPRWEAELESMMLAGLAHEVKLPGYTIIIIDVSGSMRGALSGRSDASRLDVAGVLAMIAAEMCERFTIYATAGSDPARRHNTALVPPRRGFALPEYLRRCSEPGNGVYLGGGGIFTRQALEYVRENEQGTPDRIIVLSDSQDCDVYNTAPPRPFGVRNYIVDVSAHAHGVNYAGVWTAEVSGWSDHFLRFISAMER